MIPCLLKHWRDFGYNCFVLQLNSKSNLSKALNCTLITKRVAEVRIQLLPSILKMVNLNQKFGRRKKRFDKTL